MRTFLNVLKNNYLRTVPRITSMAVITIITLASIWLAIYMTGVQQVKGHVAFITQSTDEVLQSDSKQLDITVLKRKPPYSALVKGKYDAFVTMDESGDYQIETLYNEEFKEMLLLLLTNPNAKVEESNTDRGIGVNIIGFMMMFVLMINFSNLFAFADDKEQGQLVRIAAAPASFLGYLLAHCVYCLSMLLPEYILLVFLKFLNVNIGFSLLQYAGLMLILAFLGISFGLLLNTLIGKPDNASMLGNSVTILTSVLSGSFYSFSSSKNESALKWIIKLLPQKQLMDFAEYLEDKNSWQHSVSLFYVIAFSVLLFSYSCIRLRKRYVKRV